MVEIQPGAADQGAETTGNWELKNNSDLLFFKPDAKQAARTLKIVSADKDRLVIAKENG